MRTSKSLRRHCQFKHRDLYIMNIYISLVQSNSFVPHSTVTLPKILFEVISDSKHIFWRHIYEASLWLVVSSSLSNLSKFVSRLATELLLDFRASVSRLNVAANWLILLLIVAGSNPFEAKRSWVEGTCWIVPVSKPIQPKKLHKWGCVYRQYRVCSKIQTQNPVQNFIYSIYKRHAEKTANRLETSFCHSIRWIEVKPSLWLYIGKLV